jgi:hypothetical protein
MAIKNSLIESKRTENIQRESKVTKESLNISQPKVSLPIPLGKEDEDMTLSEPSLSQ